MFNSYVSHYQRVPLFTFYKIVIVHGYVSLAVNLRVSQTPRPSYGPTGSIAELCNLAKLSGEWLSFW
jgi:hypothetical protein